ncbi:MAG: NAD-dependent epimerase/dehydratase family protein [Bacteroidetes bacterium]|nr:NAD-dependent epimerase/dehydratase family protein [Bacteroidota bacterium]
MRRILITGGAGFIGSDLAEKLLKDDRNYIVLVDDLSTGNIAKLPTPAKDRWRFIKCDVNNYRDIAGVMQSFHFDYVFHYAALVGVQRTQEHPVKVLQDLHGIENILDLCKNSEVKRVFFSSSSEVYGEPVEFPQNEQTTPLNSRVPYAVVKNIGEAFLRSYHKEFNLDYTIFRFFNTYGPKQSRDFVMSRFIALALKNKNITIYGDGSQTRTFCYIDDNIDACVTAFYNDLHINEVINIGSNIEISILDLAKLIIKFTKSDSKIVHLPELEEGDMKRRFPDITKMMKLLDREPLPIEEGIQKVLSSKLFLKNL